MFTLNKFKNTITLQKYLYFLKHVYLTP